MLDPQGLILEYAQQWSQTTALVIFAVGLLYALQGFRFARVLLAMSCAAAGWILAASLTAPAGLNGAPRIASQIAAALLLGVQPLIRYRIGVIVASTCTFAFIAFDLAAKLVGNPQVELLAVVLGALGGCSLYWLHRRCLPLLLTAIHGSLLVLLGFVGLSSDLLPELAQTFVGFASDWPWLLPLLLLILCITGYTVQLNAYQGDIVVGGGRGWNSPEQL